MKMAGCLVRHPAYGGSTETFVTAADVAVDYFFATFGAAAAFGAAARVTLWAVFCPLVST